MTTTVKYNKLSVLIERFPDYIEIIKDSYLELLSELTEVSKVDTSKFLENIQKINQMGSIIVCFLENPPFIGFKIVASGTIIIEPKIIHGCKNVGHIEDIVVKASYRGFNISQNILDLLFIEPIVYLKMRLKHLLLLAKHYYHISYCLCVFINLNHRN
jgi:hypothetical protein